MKSNAFLGIPYATIASTAPNTFQSWVPGGVYGMPKPMPLRPYGLNKPKASLFHSESQKKHLQIPGKSHPGQAVKGRAFSKKTYPERLFKHSIAHTCLSLYSVRREVSQLVHPNHGKASRQKTPAGCAALTETHRWLRKNHLGQVPLCPCCRM